MRESVFNEFIGKAMEPYNGTAIHAANGQPLDIVGVVEIGLAMPGLDNLRPTIVQMMICKSLSSDFLMGRRMLDDWDLSIKYKGKTETWIVGNQQVRAQTARQAREYNRGLIGLDYVYETQQGWRASMKINSGRGPWKRYRWADITQSFLPPPPLKNPVCNQPRFRKIRGPQYNVRKVTRLNLKKSPLMLESLAQLQTTRMVIIQKSLEFIYILWLNYVYYIFSLLIKQS